ncbi:hypothetical protein [Actinomadura gamaensis]|uniref:AAA+ ATPase domain-containing protein n=1 Tax=Actinomadura gamaensis TaxID=1763541 RepID=A0ABV9UAV5_9ACTN
MKVFNTAGPCVPGKHYMLDPLARLPRAQRLAEQGSYFVVHGPRQSGKTTLLTLLAQALNATGRYAALCFSWETAARVEDVAAIPGHLLAAMRDAAEDYGLPDACLPPDPWPDAPYPRVLVRALSSWAAKSLLPLVLLCDEVDLLAGSALGTVLRQLRDGATSPTMPFPHSIALCGIRDVSRCTVVSDEGSSSSGTPVPFNISVASLRISDFSLDEVAELYGQHTEATGQVFEAAAVQRAFEASQGQPWLVNALAGHACAPWLGAGQGAQHGAGYL